MEEGLVNPHWLVNTRTTPSVTIIIIKKKVNHDQKESTYPNEGVVS